MPVIGPYLPNLPRTFTLGPITFPRKLVQTPVHASFGVYYLDQIDPTGFLNSKRNSPSDINALGILRRRISLINNF